MITREEALRELKFMQTGVHMDTWSRDAVTWALAALEAEPEPLAKAEGWLSQQWIDDINGVSKFGKVLVLLPMPISPTLVPVTVAITERKVLPAKEKPTP
jgi:hypothetical protein